MDQTLIESVTHQTGLALKLEKEVTNRRGARLLRLSAGGDYFALKIGADVTHEAAVIQQLGEFCKGLYVADGFASGVPWLLQRWVGGQSVYRRVRQILEESSEPSLLIGLYAAMFSKVAELHTLGFLHGDIQPNHFRIDVDSDHIHLLDFALTHRLGSTEPSGYPGALVHFSAPEVCQQQLSNRPVAYTQQAELYSLASTVFFLHTGKLSADYGVTDFMAMSLDEKRRCIAAGKRNRFRERHLTLFEQLIEKCMALNPANRFATVEQVADRLKAK